MIPLQNAIKDLVSQRILTANEFENGPKIDPLKIIQIYEATEWETFIDEWIHSLTDDYTSVMRPAGAGDKGIDVAGLCDEDQLKGVWDNYQCKHSRKAIGFPIVGPDIGKILWFSYSGVYKAPRHYWFVAPLGATPSVTLLLANADQLKAKIIETWNKSIGPHIAAQPIELTGEFRNYVEGFDFRIFSVASPRAIIEAHAKTPYHPGRFGVGLPSRPHATTVPVEIGEHEGTYTSKLLDAYGEHKAQVIATAADIDKWPILKSHFQRSRESFYHAESLRIFVREKVEPGTFESFQNEILGGVLDTHDSSHVDGYARVVAVTDKAQQIVLDAHPLNKSALANDRRGVCHQLANDGKLTWKQ